MRLARGENSWRRLLGGEKFKPRLPRRRPITRRKENDASIILHLSSALEFLTSRLSRLKTGGTFVVQIRTDSEPFSLSHGYRGRLSRIDLVKRAWQSCGIDRWSNAVGRLVASYRTNDRFGATFKWQREGRSSKEWKNADSKCDIIGLNGFLSKLDVSFLCGLTKVLKNAK